MLPICAPHAPSIARTRARGTRAGFYIDSEPARLRVLLVLHDQRVRVQRLQIHATAVVLVGKVEAHRVREIDVDLIGKAVLLALLAQLALELARLLCPLQPAAVPTTLT